MDSAEPETLHYTCCSIFGWADERGAFFQQTRSVTERAETVCDRLSLVHESEKEKDGLGAGTDVDTPPRHRTTASLLPLLEPDFPAN